MKDLRLKRKASSRVRKVKCGGCLIGKSCTEVGGYRSANRTKISSPVKKGGLDLTCHSPCLLTALVKCSISEQKSCTPEINTNLGDGHKIEHTIESLESEMFSNSTAEFGAGTFIAFSYYNECRALTECSIFC